MFVFAAIAVAAPLATGSAMSLPRFLHGHVPVRDRGRASCSTGLGRALRGGLLVLSAPGSRPACGRPTRAAALRRNLAHRAGRSPSCTAAAALAYHGDGKDLPATYFYPRAHAVAHGTHAYGGLDYEYPPATLPLLIAPLAAGGDDSGPGLPPAHDLAVRGLDVVCVAAPGVPAAPQARDRAGAGARALQRRRARARPPGADALRPRGRPRDPRSRRTRAQRGGRAGAWLGVAGALKLVPLAAAPALARRGTTPAHARRRRAVPDRRPGRLHRSGAASSGSRGSATTRAATPRSSPGRRSSPTSPAPSAPTRARPSTTAARTSRAARRAGSGASSRSRRSGSRCCSPAACAASTPIRALALLAALALLVAVAPVLSPQYLLWLAPLSALLAPRYPLQAVLLALACVLTRLELSFAFDDLPHFHWSAIALVRPAQRRARRRSHGRCGARATGRASGTPTRPA